MSQPNTPSQAPELGTPSRIPPPSAEALSAVEGTVKRLRAELAGTQDRNRQSRLLTEIGEIEERAGDEPGAARDYLAAYNADPTFREPLEGLVRLLERRRSLKNLGKLVDALLRVAQNPDEKARALLMKATYLEDVGGDLDGAKNAAREATLTEAPEAEAANAWLSLEILAAKEADAILREEALGERAKRAGEGAWRGLLLLDQAKLVAALGEVDRAIEVLGQARAVPQGAFPAAAAIERLARREPGLPGSDEARSRAEARAAALEAQGAAIKEALEEPSRGDALGVPRWMRNVAVMADAFLRAADARRLQGDLTKSAELLDRARQFVATTESQELAIGEAVTAEVPAHTGAETVEAEDERKEKEEATTGDLPEPLRELASLTADDDDDDEDPPEERTLAYDKAATDDSVTMEREQPPPRAKAAAESSAQTERSERTSGPRQSSSQPERSEGTSDPRNAPAKPPRPARPPSLVESALVNARMRVAELMGDTALAAELASARLEWEKDGGTAAALAMRVAEQAASEGDATRALDALSRAVQADAASLPARALQLDLLADAGETAAFASQLESFAEHLGTDEARGRAFLLAAFSWGISAGDVASAKAALSQAAMYGVAPGTVARFARAMAAVRGDTAWYEEATRRLIASGASEAEVVPLGVELYRARAGRGDVEGAAKALREIGAAPKGAWLGRVLEAFLPDAPKAPAEEDLDPERTAVRGEERRRAALEELAGLEPSADVARGLSLLAAMRSHAAADAPVAKRRLSDLFAKDPSDPLVASYLGDLTREADGAEAADIASRAAAATTDVGLAAALHLEAGFERWRIGERKAALDAFAEAEVGAPEAAKIVLGWAARGVDADTVEGRRRALERAADGGGEARLIALERFANEVSGGDPDDASVALSTLESEAEGDLAIAGALARLAWSPGAADQDALRTAIARIATLSRESSSGAPLPAVTARTFALAERVRLAQGGDAEELATACKAWFEAGGGMPAALEWLAAAAAIGEASSEKAAREALAETLTGEAREAVMTSAVLLGIASGAESAAPPPLVVGQSSATRLANLELAPPGADPRRRASALVELDGALGDEAELDALALAGWSAIAGGEIAAATVAFETVTTARASDLASWEGLRTCGERAGDKALRARAAAALGARVAADPRGAAFWEEAALLHLELGDTASAVAAFDAGFARDATRHVSFDKLFRAVRDKKDGDKLLALITRRLDVTDDPAEIAKLFWEQARVLREKGDQDAALKALEHVTMLEPDHVGALALTGEISLKRGLFEEAATALARLSALAAAPPKNRVTAGVAAVDIFENKLDRFDKALEVLLGLHRAKLSTLPVRERLARAAARTGTWGEATAILEELMHERPEADGRIEAARLSMAIHRDRLGDANGARAAIVKLLEESPADGEALDMLLQTEHRPEVRARLLAGARTALLAATQARPTDLPAVKRLAKVARAEGDDALQQAALSAVVLLSGNDGPAEQALAQLMAKKPRLPSVALTEQMLRTILAPGDEGPIAQLFHIAAPTLSEALGPSLQACGVTKKDKVDPRSGIALRNEIATWAGAFGVAELDLYVGGKDPLGVQGVPGEVPSLVVGAGLNAPLAPLARARIARELHAISRGTTIVRTREDMLVAVAAIVVALCSIAEVRIDHPPYAMLADFEKQIGRAISRKTKKLLPDVCRAVAASGVDPTNWARRALASQARVAAVASGDAGVVLIDVMNEPLERLGQSVKGDVRAEELLRFVLSPAYLGLRKAFGLEGGT